MTKQELKEEILKWYEPSEEELTKHGDDVDEFLIDWVDTLIEETLDGGSNWNDAIEFIVFNCNHKIKGVRAYKRQNGVSFMETIDLPKEKNNKRTGKTNQISCGTYDNIISAIKARKKAEKRRQVKVD